MLKHVHRHSGVDIILPAAFGRLCVETEDALYGRVHFGPAAFGRLCVETIACIRVAFWAKPSRLRAAVC